MAKTRPDKKHKARRKHATNGESELSPAMAQKFLDQATELLHMGQPDEALKVAQKALNCLSSSSAMPIAQMPILELLGEIHLELGDQDSARSMFLTAAERDPDAELLEEEGGGPDKFLTLAQLSEEGGKESVEWFQKGIKVLRREISARPSRRARDNVDGAGLIGIREKKLAEALCGVAEVYMTDLSWEEDAETICENSVTEACLVSPDTPEPLQTLASVRISQSRMEEAKSALQQSLDLWKDLEPEDSGVPSYPTRISLARLLMEAEMEEQALEVLDRLVSEDDSSVEAWYLGGWCLYLLAEKQRYGEEPVTVQQDQAADKTKLQRGSRIWLTNSLKLYETLEYEDERLMEHARELILELDGVLGPAPDNEGDEDEWEDEESVDVDEDEGPQDEDMKEA